jgi:hypothetical protein
MLRSRNGRPSLIGSAARTAGRTAVVVKTANAMNARDAQKQAARASAAAPAAPAATPATAAPAAPAGGLTEDSIARLQQLGDLHKSGILSDAEFAEAKARILAG